MRSVIRVFVVTAVFAFIAGYGRPAFSGSAPPVDENQIRLWSDWCVNEVLWHYVPRPQLLDICDQSPEEIDGGLHLTLSVIDLYPFSSGRKHDWYQEKAGRLSTDAIVLPCAIQFIADSEYMGAYWVRRSQVADRTFTGLRNMHSTSTIHSVTFSESQYENGDLLKLDIPKRLSEYGAYLRLFEYVLARRNSPFFDPDRCY